MERYLAKWTYKGLQRQSMHETREHAEKHLASFRRPGFPLDTYDHGIAEVRDGPELLRLLVHNHDLTFQYADDHRVWKRGIHSHEAIVTLKEALIATGEITLADFIALWNAWVDEQLVAPHNTQFHWKE